MKKINLLLLTCIMSVFLLQLKSVAEGGKEPHSDAGKITYQEIENLRWLTIIDENGIANHTVWSANPRIGHGRAPEENNEESNNDPDEWRPNDQTEPKINLQLAVEEAKAYASLMHIETAFLEAKNPKYWQLSESKQKIGLTHTEAEIQIENLLYFLSLSTDTDLPKETKDKIYDYFTRWFDFAVTQKNLSSLIGEISAFMYWIKITAPEKNPEALKYLESLYNTDWASSQAKRLANVEIKHLLEP